MDERLNEALESLKTLRDEVRLQIHLGKAELKDEWEQLEHKWQETEQKIEAVGEEAKEKAEDVHNALNVVVEELSSAYSRIKQRLD